MRITFLGQSGFLLEGGGRRVAFDPFLGPLEDPAERAKFPRQIEPPMSGTSLGPLDLVLVSHHHGDHCHAATLNEIAEVSPACRFVVTPSSRDLLSQTGFPIDRAVVPVFPGWLSCGSLNVCIVPARHYEFSYRDDAIFDFFGFVLEIDGRRVFHAGDTIPYPGFFAVVASLTPDVSLIPVNGRDAAREAEGVVGNLTADECADFVRVCGSSLIVPCHFGMFAGNSVDIDVVASQLAQAAPRARVQVPEPGGAIEFP